MMYPSSDRFKVGPYEKTLKRVLVVEVLVLWIPIIIVVVVKLIHPTPWLLVTGVVFLLVTLPLLIITAAYYILSSWVVHKWLKVPRVLTSLVILGTIVWLWLVF